MSFFTTSDGQAIGNDKEFDASGGFGDPLPDNTDVLASVDNIAWDEYEGERSIRIQWSILGPQEYKNRKLFQSIKVDSADPKKRDKALRMLAALDSMHGGKLMALGQEPGDHELTAALVNKLAVLKIGYYDMTEQGGKIGNWVKAVAERKAGTPAPTPPPTRLVKDSGKPAKAATAIKGPAKAHPAAVNNDSMFDDDIPF